MGAQHGRLTLVLIKRHIGPVWIADWRDFRRARIDITLARRAPNLRPDPGRIGVDSYLRTVKLMTADIPPCDRLEDSERLAAVSDLDEGDGLFDQPLQLLQIAGRPIAVPIAAATLALGEQIARVLADRLRIDGGSVAGRLPCCVVTTARPSSRARPRSTPQVPSHSRHASPAARSAGTDPTRGAAWRASCVR
jgi:hypothetical protein